MPLNLAFDAVDVVSDDYLLLFDGDDTPVFEEGAPAWRLCDPGVLWRPSDPSSAWGCQVSCCGESEITQETLYKRPAWARAYTVDFSRYAEVRAGQTIVSVGSAVTSPTDLVVPSTLTISSDGKKVQFRLAGGTAGQEYTVLTSDVTLSDGSVLDAEQLLRVED